MGSRVCVTSTYTVRGELELDRALACEFEFGVRYCARSIDVLYVYVYLTFITFIVRRT